MTVKSDDPMRDRAMQDDRPGRTFCKKGAARTVALPDGKLRDMPASNITVEEIKPADGSRRYWVCDGCSLHSQAPGMKGVIHLDAIDMVDHMVRHRVLESALVPVVSIIAVCCQAVYDAGYEGDYR